MSHKHEDNFYGEAMQKASLLKQEKFSEGDMKNIIELKFFFRRLLTLFINSWRKTFCPE